MKSIVCMCLMLLFPFDVSLFCKAYILVHVISLCLSINILLSDHKYPIDSSHHSCLFIVPFENNAPPVCVHAISFYFWENVYVCILDKVLDCWKICWSGILQWSLVLDHCAFCLCFLFTVRLCEKNVYQNVIMSWIISIGWCNFLYQYVQHIISFLELWIVNWNKISKLDVQGPFLIVVYEVIDNFFLFKKFWVFCSLIYINFLSNFMSPTIHL